MRAFLCVLIMLDEIPAVCKAMTLAGVIGFIRVIKDGKPRLFRQLIEVPFCGALAVVGHYGIKAVGLANYEDVSVFIAGCIGVLGSDFVRLIARKFTEARIKGLI